MGGAVADARSAPLSGIVPADGWCVVLGNEEAGLAEELTGICHELACIPMASGADSLNVSVAAGIILNHMTSRAGTAPQARIVPLSGGSHSRLSERATRGSILAAISTGKGEVFLSLRSACEMRVSRVEDRTWRVSLTIKWTR